MVYGILGLIIFFIAPITALPLTLIGFHIAETKGEVLFWSFMMAVYVGILGYCFKDPMTDPDIVRYIDMCKLYQHRALPDCFNLVYNNLFVIDIWFFLISRIGDWQLVPASAVFFFYFIAYYVIGDYKRRSRMATMDFALLVFWVTFSCQFVFILNSFRSYVTYAMFFFGVYREQIQKKKDFWNILIYVAPIFMHFSGILLIMIRAVAAMKRKPWFLISASVLMMKVILGILAPIARGMGSGGALGQAMDIIVRADMYFNWNTGGWAERVANSGYYTLVKVFCLGITVVSLYLILKDVYHKADPSYLTLRKKSQILVSDTLGSYAMIYLLVTLETFLITAPECFRFVFPIVPFLGIYYIASLTVKEPGSVDAVALRCFMLGSGAIGIFLNYYNLNTMIPAFDYLKNVAQSGIMMFGPGAGL